MLDTKSDFSCEAPIASTAYNEPAAGAQRSLKSASANDAAAGTGARKVRITYYTLDATTGEITGPFTEVVTLNGVTAVPTVDLDIALIERMELVAVGSGGVAAGNITLYSDNAGVGSVVAVLAAGQVCTWFGHHYVPTGKRCSITDLEALGGDAAVATVDVKRKTYPVTGPELPLLGAHGTTATLPRGIAFADSEHRIFPGPCRLVLYVTPQNANAQLTQASFGYVDR